MRVKLLRDEEDGVTVRLVYPATLDEYGETFEILGGRAAGRGGSVAGHGSYVVTTEEQRARWRLPDLLACGRARVVDEAEAFGLLCDAPAATVAAPRWSGGPGGSAVEAIRALAAPDTRLDQVLEVLDGVDLPGPVCETLRRALRQTRASRAVGKVLDRVQRVLALPWRQRSPARFDAAAVSQALERTHGARAGQAAPGRGAGGVPADPRPAHGGSRARRPGRGYGRAVRAGGAAGPGRGRGAGSLSCRSRGDRQDVAGRGRRPAALGRAHVEVTLGGQDVGRLIHGVDGGGAGRIIEGLCAAGVNNLVFVLEAIDRVDTEAAEVLLDVLERAPARVRG